MRAEVTIEVRARRLHHAYTVRRVYRTARLGRGERVHVMGGAGAGFGWPLCGHTAAGGMQHRVEFVPDAPTCAGCIKKLQQQGITLEEE